MRAIPSDLDPAVVAEIDARYLHVGLRQLDVGAPSLKRFFYALRPAAALRWLADHPGAALPPMDLPTLLAESTVEQDVRDAAAQLIATKSVTREFGTGAPPAVLERFVAVELERAAGFDGAHATRPPGEVRACADALFRAEIG